MKYVGIDYGARRIGVAVSDEAGVIAFPRAVIENDEKAVAFVKRLIEEEKAEAVVMGDTRTVSGAANPVTQEAEHFVEMLTRETGIPVERAWEGFSSIEASRYDPKERHDDSAAAAIILQRFLDMKGGE